MTLNLTIPQQLHTDFTPHITVIGVGGGGTNAVDNMIALDLKGVDFVVANTDAQQLIHSKAERRIQLGPHITQGLGAGAKPEIGRAAAEEAADELYRYLEGVHMVFITAGMGGGTGTGAAPVIARMARERNILTVGVVTKPFAFEGSRRARAAELGIEDLQQYVDTLIVIPNQNLFRLANERTGWKEAFKMADHVLYMGVRGVTDLMMSPGLVNLDFADIRTVMAEMGKAMMGTGEADGENRAVRAAEAAISNPLLEDTNMAGARGLLINITGGEDMTLFEVDQAANRVRDEVEEDANIIFGSAIDESLEGKIRVSVVATGIDTPAALGAVQRPHLVAVGGVAEPEPAEAKALEPAAASADAGAGRLALPPAPKGIRQLTRSAPLPPLGGVRVAAQEAAAEALVRQTAIPPVVAHRAPLAAAGGGAAAERLDPSPQLPRAVHRGLFAPVSRPAAQAAAELADAEGAAPAPPRAGSLFGIVTGSFRRARPNAAQLAEALETADAPALQDVPEPPRASVRVAGGEEMGLDIPAFLRRQSS